MRAFFWGGGVTSFLNLNKEQEFIYSYFKHVVRWNNVKGIDCLEDYEQQLHIDWVYRKRTPPCLTSGSEQIHCIPKVCQ